MPVISIIIPVYNTSQYLRECLDSICTQSYTDWECLLVDDGSTDDSGDICDKYAEKDSRFKALHIKNGGASCARNYGIGKACGEWIAFVDSDDKVLPDYLRNLINAVESERADVVLSNYGGRQEDMHIKENRRLEGEQMIDYFLVNSIFALSAPYGKLYNNKIIEENNIQFPIGINMGEDLVFLGRYMNCINSASLITDCSYIVNNIEGSLSKKYYSFESEYRCFELWKKEITNFVDVLTVSKTQKEQYIWNNRTAGALFRSIESMHKGARPMSFVFIIKTLRQMPKAYFSHLDDSFFPDSMSAIIKKNLLFRRLFFSYTACSMLFRIFGK